MGRTTSVDTSTTLLQLRHSSRKEPPELWCTIHARGYPAIPIALIAVAPSSVAASDGSGNGGSQADRSSRRGLRCAAHARNRRCAPYRGGGEATRDFADDGCGAIISDGLPESLALGDVCKECLRGDTQSATCTSLQSSEETRLRRSGWWPRWEVRWRQPSRRRWRWRRSSHAWRRRRRRRRWCRHVCG